MRVDSVPNLRQFLGDHPEMALKPSRGDQLSVSGIFRFDTQYGDFRRVEDKYDLLIVIPEKFPSSIPLVYELSQKLVPKSQFHVNTDGSLCLGSRLHLLTKLRQNPTFTGFIETCLIPHLYAMSHKLQHGGDLVFGELEHGEVGTFVDYKDLFGLDGIEKVLPTLKVLGKKKGIANKMPCPCGCGKQLGRCRFNETIRKFRIGGITRGEFRQEYQRLISSGKSQ